MHSYFYQQRRKCLAWQGGAARGDEGRRMMKEFLEAKHYYVQYLNIKNTIQIAK